MEESTLAILGIVATLIIGAPAWFPYLKKKWISRKKSPPKDTTDGYIPNHLKSFGKEFGEIISCFRIKEKLSEEDFASLIDEDLSKDMITKWENGLFFPVDNLPELLDVLGIVESDFDSLALKHISSSELSLLKKNANKKKSLQKNIVLLRRSMLLGSEDRTEPIYVIAPYSSLTSQFRERSSPNYVFIDNLGDRDSLLELVITLARLFPFSPINFYHSMDFPSRLLENDLILIGGIGYPDSPNNHVALSLVQERNIPLRYDGDTLFFGRRRWNSKYKNEILTYDIGFFANLKNPWNLKKRIISMQGVHTSGVLGSVRAFSLNAPAIENHRLAQKLYGNKDYCAIFGIRLFGNRPIIPNLKEKDFFAI